MMKKFTQFLSALVFFGLIFTSNSGFAQLSGSYTIGSSGNYSTFSAAVSALYSSGVNGAVTFTVQSGTYNERAYFTAAISGASASNTITFDGVSRSSVTLQYSGTSTATVRLYMADYITFKNMTIKHTSTSIATAVSFRNNADHNTISNCHLEVPLSSSANVKVVMFSNHDYSYSSGSNYHGSYNLIEDCTIKGGYMGITIYGTSYNTSTYNHHNSFIGNEITDQYYYGIRLYNGVGHVTIQNNTIHNFTYANAYAIYMYRCNNSTIDGNVIKPGYFGLYMYYENYNATGTTYITNNMISDFQYANYNRGLYLYYCRYLNVLHNSIHAGGSTSTYSNAAIYLYSSSSATYYGNHKIKNNILSVYGGCYAISVYYPYGCQIDYNDYYYPTGGNRFYQSGSIYSNLAGFKSRTTYIGTHDQNSWDNKNPYFASSTDLHIEPPTSLIMYAPAIAAQNLGFDVDGDARPTSGNVIIGADQVLPVDLDVTDFTPVVAMLGNNTVSMTLKNKGLNPITPQTFSVHYKIDNGSWVTESMVVTTNWDLGVAKIFTFSTPWNVTQDASYNVCVKVDPQLTSDPDPADEICRTVGVGMAGTYTIGVGNYDYQTFSAAASDLYSKGVSDTVIFSVQSGTYNERLNLSNSINGASATSPIIFDGGNRSSVTLQYSGTTVATVRFFDADYVTLKNMTIKHTSTSIATAVSFRSDADHNTISNCHLEVPVSSSSNVKVIMFSNHDYSYSYGANNHGAYNLIEDCTIKGGWIGVTIYGAGYTGSFNHHNSFIGNEFTNQYSYGIRFYYGVGHATIQNNTIHNFGSTSAYALYLYRCNNTIIDANIIKPGYYGLYMYYENYYAPGTTYITNNMISDFKYPTYNRGLYLYYCRYLNVLHNSIHSGGTSTSYTNAAIYMYSSSSSTYYSNSIIKNNILSVYNRGFAISLYYPYGCQVDYNDYFYTGGGNKFFLNTYFTNFSSFKNYTGYIGTHDQNSDDNVNPNFVSATDLHVTAAVLQAPVVLPSSPDLQHDVDDQPRSSTGTNWIGADKPPPMVYSGITSIQDTTTGVIGTNLSKILLVQVNFTGLSDPLPVTSLTFTTGGSSNPTDIKSARLFNKDSNPLELANQVGSTINNPSGTFTFNLTGVAVPLDGFYLAYDISPSATIGNTLDCTFESATIDGTVRYPTVTSPAGFQSITHHATADHDTTDAFIGQTSVRLLHVEVRTGVGGTTNRLPVTAMYFSTNGTTNTNDLLEARLYHTNNSTPLNSGNVVGSAIVNPNGSFFFTFNETLSTSTIDHYWIAYDISSLSTISNVIDCTFDSVVIDGITYIPETSNPTGSRTLVHPSSYTAYCDQIRSVSGTAYLGIAMFELEDISNSTGMANTAGSCLSFYPSPIPVLYKKVTYPLKIKQGVSNNRNNRLYIDWDNDGYFESSEIVKTWNNITAGSTLEDNITIPCNTTTGIHRLRLISDFYAYPVPTACVTQSYGEAEDYLIYISAEDTPVVSFTHPDSGFVGGTTQFISTCNIEGDIDFIWDYDYSVTFTPEDTGVIGSVVYNTASTKLVALQAYSNGCVNTLASNLYISSINIIAPTTPPVSNFISNLNFVTTSIPAEITDLTTLGPFKWKWVVSPALVNGNTSHVFFPSDTVQNPHIYFNELGVYDIKLIATNLVGSDSVVKIGYITVVKDQIMCVDNFSSEPKGYLYDDGGTSNYSDPPTNTGVLCTYLIAPKCASDIKIDFLDFDVCSIGPWNTCPGAQDADDHLAIYDGEDNTGTPLHLQFINPISGQPIYPNGFTNGSQNVVVLPPSVTSTSGYMYLEWYRNCAGVGSGFKAKWTALTYMPNNPVAGISAPAVIYTGKTLYFVNTSTGDYLDYAWDLDGDGLIDVTDYQPSHTYNTAETIDIMLIVYSCHNLIDTFIQQLMIIDPPPRPVVDFAVNFNKLTPRDMAIFTDLSDSSVLSWEWSFTPNTVTYQDGTNRNSQDIHVQFIDTGYYSVKLQAWNYLGDSFELKNNYVWVYSYCNPGVGSLNADIGISEVILQNSLGDTLINQLSPIGEIGYTDYSTNQIAELALGGTYILTMKRNSTFNNISRSAWIDYSRDGDFNDPMELLFSQHNSPTLSLTDSFTIPLTASLGLTRLRLGTNLGILSNKGCGPNYSGEFEDYGVVITEDNEKPVIYLLNAIGSIVPSPDTIYVNKCGIFTNPGCIALDNVDGIITSKVIWTGPTVTTNVTGTYPLAAGVRDNAGNDAESVYRIVIVKPNTIPPIITLIGNNPDTVAVFGSWSDAGYVASAFCGTVKWDTSYGTVNPNQVGVYTITYIATDDDNNTDTIYRNVVVVDMIDPTIVLKGDNPFYMEVNTSFNDPGVDIFDNVNNNLFPDITGYLDTSRIGTYFLRYCATDSSDNGPVCVDRKVITYDSTAPLLTLIGADTICIDVFHNFIDPGYVVSDNYWPIDNITVTITESINTYQLGYYEITYVAKDGSGNESATFKRIVCVEDNEAPTIKLNGPGIVTILKWNDFEDPGVTSIDNYYDESKIIISYNENGTWDSSSKHYLGIYTYTYKACDPSDNCSDEITRLLYVEENVSITTNLVVDGNISFYPNPAKNELNIDIELPDHNNVKIGIYNTLGEKVLNVFDGIIKDEHFNVNIENLSSGVYYIRFNVGDSQYLNKKFIIAK